MITERLKYLGGSCQIESRPGSGTQITLSAKIKDHA
jgi:signal transduction histidine kinase